MHICGSDPVATMEINGGAFRCLHSTHMFRQRNASSSRSLSDTSGRFSTNRNHHRYPSTVVVSPCPSRTVTRHASKVSLSTRFHVKSLLLAGCTMHEYLCLGKMRHVPARFCWTEDFCEVGFLVLESQYAVTLGLSSRLARRAQGSYFRQCREQGLRMTQSNDWL